MTKPSTRRRRDITELFVEQSLKVKSQQRVIHQYSKLISEERARASAEQAYSRTLLNEIEELKGLPEVVAARSNVRITENAEALRASLLSSHLESIPTHEVVAFLDALLGPREGQ